MTARTRSPQLRSSKARPAQRSTPTAPVVEQVRLGWAEAPARLRLACAAAVLGALLVAAGPLLGVVSGDPAPGYSATALLIVVALLPVALALVLVTTGRALLGAGVLVAAAAFVPGRALLDLQIATDALRATRPELYVPTSLAPLSAAPGLWLMIGGHLLAAAAGLLAAGRAGAEPGSAFALELDEPAQQRSMVTSRHAAGIALVLGFVVTVGLWMPPVHSSDAFLLATDVLGAPSAALGGGVLLALAVPVLYVWSAGTGNPAVYRGTVLGAFCVLLALALPPLAAAAAMPRLESSAGPVIALVGGAAAVLAAYWPRLRDREDTDADGPPRHETELELRPRRLHLATGVLGVLAAVAAVTSAFVPVLTYAEGLAQPGNFVTRPAIPAGVLVGLLALCLLVGTWAAVVRPAFVVAGVAIVVTSMSALGNALAPGYGPYGQVVESGAGLWFAVIALVLVVLAMSCAVVAGSAEREDVDLTERSATLSLIAPGSAAVLLALGAFGFPAVRSPGFATPGIFSQFQVASWGLVAALLVVVGVVAIAPWCRPPRAAALLLGASGLVALRALDFPLTGGRVAGSQAAQGTWLAAVCALALLVSAVVAVTARPTAPTTRRR